MPDNFATALAYSLSQRRALLTLRRAIHAADAAARDERAALITAGKLWDPRRKLIERERDSIAELAPRVWDLISAQAQGTNHVIKVSRLIKRGAEISPARWGQVSKAFSRLFPTAATQLKSAA